MKQVKRQQFYCFDNYDENERKKIRIESCNNMPRESITCFEGLPNELIYEVFKCLDYFHVYKAFFNLNLRFHDLITNSSLPIEINISSMSKSEYQQYYSDIIETRTHRINSLCLSNIFVCGLVQSPIRILSTFCQLGRLIVDNIQSKYLENLLLQLMSLSSLTSLTIISLDDVNNTNLICRQIFRLPALTYCKLSMRNYRDHDVLIPSTTDSYSPIEHLIIDNDLDLSQIYSLLSYVPQLRRLSLQRPSVSWKQRANTSPPTLKHLTHVSLNLDRISFDRFEEIVKNLFSTIQVLYTSIEYNTDDAYKDSRKWEQLILYHMPNLRVFDIRDVRKATHTTDNNNLPILDNHTNQFTSSFWIKKQWFFALQHYKLGFGSRQIFYSTCPYRRKYYGLFKQLNAGACVNPCETNLSSVHHLEIQCVNEIINCTHYFTQYYCTYFGMWIFN
ncbi:unnamed protein product [Rotaria magnacalcarata]|uniref:F-box domain-containing protein n=1 Tax=Rotaria magnacalcarata TaxID=392030 RepID=A0A816UU72_9BILA|nr:unnamed protein product [Rotaria magnacalcarata]